MKTTDLREGRCYMLKCGAIVRINRICGRGRNRGVDTVPRRFSGKLRQFARQVVAEQLELTNGQENLFR